jgi:hypothetical protein
MWTWSGVAHKEQNIYKRVNQYGDERYVVRIGDKREPSGYFFNGTFKNIDTARAVRDEQEAKYILSKQNKKESLDNSI